MASPTVTREWYLPKIGTFEDLKIKEANLPTLHSNEVLVKIHAVSLNYRDLIISTGQYPASPPPDLVPCSDMAGEVLEVGSQVTRWRKGDRVSANFSLVHLDGDPSPETSANTLGGPIHGVLTQFKVFPELSLVSIPPQLSYQEASTLPCAAVTAYNALLGPIPVKAGDVVVVQGTGGVSIFGLQLAVASGATVIATSSSDEKLKVAQKLGAKHLINYNTTPNWEEEVNKLTNGRGADHILEVGGAGTLARSLKAIRSAGWIHIIGLLTQTDNPVDIIPFTIRKGLMIRGIQIGSVAQFNDMNRLLAAHPEATKPVIDKVFSFEDAIEAYTHLKSQKHIGKVVIQVSKD